MSQIFNLNPQIHFLVKTRLAETEFNFFKLTLPVHGPFDNDFNEISFFRSRIFKRFVTLTCLIVQKKIWWFVVNKI